jgi:hypothetical protein
MDELAAAGSSMNPLANAFNALESVTGGTAGPSSAADYHDSSLQLNSGVTMGNGLSDSNLVMALAAVVGVVLFVMRKK